MYLDNTCDTNRSLYRTRWWTQTLSKNDIDKRSTSVSLDRSVSANMRSAEITQDKAVDGSFWVYESFLSTICWCQIWNCSAYLNCKCTPIRSSATATKTYFLHNFYLKKGKKWSKYCYNKLGIMAFFFFML